MARVVVVSLGVFFLSVLAFAGLQTKGSQAASKEEAPRAQQVSKAKAASPKQTVAKTVSPGLQAVRVEIPNQRLLAALIRKESKGNDYAVGDTDLDEWAYGCLQIRQPCVDDVNRHYGTNYRAENCLGNRRLSVEICQKYVAMYATQKKLGRAPTNEDVARIWNGGPKGWKHTSTRGYWATVQKYL
jgi:hypothetical protein